MEKWRLPGALAAVFVASLIGYRLTSDSWQASWLWALAGSGSLMGGLFQLWRSQIAHERERRLILEERAATVGLASHMANTTFDKHVEFAERYVKTVQEEIARGWKETMGKDALPFAISLHHIRRDFAIWVPTEVAKNLQAFEQALREIGADGHLLEHLPVGDKRTEVVERMFHKFEIAIGLREAANETEQRYASEEVIRLLREVLGVEELTRLRAHVLATAVEALK